MCTNKAVYFDCRSARHDWLRIYKMLAISGKLCSYDVISNNLGGSMEAGPNHARRVRWLD